MEYIYIIVHWYRIKGGRTVSDDDKNEFTKVNVRKPAKKIIKQIVAKEGGFEYEFIERLLKEKYPSYFRKGISV
jgi:hypothetical protein